MLFRSRARSQTACRLASGWSATPARDCGPTYPRSCAREGVSSVWDAERSWGKPSVNRGKITSTNSTHPTSKIAKQNPLQRNARHTEPLSRSDLVHAQRAEFAKFGPFPDSSLSYSVQRKPGESPKQLSPPVRQGYSSSCNTRLSSSLMPLASTRSCKL